MRQLRRMGLINWHILPAMDIDIAGHAGVIGENRSGKTTLLDMIQVVMTGNAARYRKLNASASDSGRKGGDRTVHAYCLGRLSRDLVIRPDGALTYIFLVFGEGAAACTIGLALEASPAETAERTLGQFIVPGRALSVADFTDRVDGGEQPRDWALVRPWLESLPGCSVYRDQAKQFVSDFLKALSTGARFIDADRFRKAFVNAISFDRIESATEFVRLYLLERRDIRIGQLRESVATYQQLRKNVEEARRKLELLCGLRGLLDSFKADLATYDTQRWIAARARLDWQFVANRRLKTQVSRATTELREAQHEITEYDRLKAEKAEELDRVSSDIQQQSLGRRPEFETQRKLADKERAEALRELGILQQSVTQAAAVVRHRDRLGFAEPMLDLIGRAHQAAGSRMLPAWPVDAASLSTLLDDAAPKLEAVQQRCQQEIDDTIRRSTPLDERGRELRRRIADIERKGVSLESNVETLAAELQELGFRPRILCTLLEVTDEQWRHAAEALLGRDREAILVDVQFVDDAIRHLQRNRQRFRGCRIVNTRKLDPGTATPEPSTLASVLRSGDSMAMAFVIRRIGNVRLAETIQDLHRPGRAIMRDGTYDDGLAVEMREVVRGNKIGAGAGRAGLAALQAELAEVAAEVQQAGQHRGILRSAQQSFEAFARAAGRGADLLRFCDQLQRADERLEQIAADLRALEQNIDPGLRERAKRLADSVTTYDSEARAATVRATEAKHAIFEASGKLNSGDAEPGANLALQAAYAAFNKLRYLRSIGRPAYRAALTAARRDFRRLADTADTLAREVRERFQKTEREAFDQYFDYHRMFGLKPDFTRESELVRDIEPWVDRNMQRIQENDLVRYETEAREAADRTRSLFQHSFAFELRDRFDALQSAIDETNRTLAGHDFHYERYRFTKRPVELYRDIITLVDESRTDPALFLPLFDSAVPDTHPHAKALKTVQALLLDETRDIGEFEDYRKYFTFSLKMRDLKTGREMDLEDRRGTGSGAEQQVPFYVAIGTALAVAYHGRAAGDASRTEGIGLAVLDEAFAKLDGKNQKACMEYYQKLGLQVIVAAPFEKRASLYESMDCFVETIRSGDSIDIDAYRIGDRTREAFSDANPANLGLDRFRQLKAQAQRPDAA